MISLVIDAVDFDVLTKSLWAKSQHPAGEDLTETDLHYTLFPSLITFKVGGVAVIGPRRRVPLFDFLACVARSVKGLRANESTSMGFTEAADRVTFLPKKGSDVEISASGSGFLVRVDRMELVAALEEFLSVGRARLIDNVPGIQRNPQMVKLIM